MNRVRKTVVLNKYFTNRRNQVKYAVAQDSVVPAELKDLGVSIVNSETGSED